MEVFLVFSTLIRTFAIDLGIFSHYDKKIRMKRVIAILLLTAGVLGAIRGTDFRHDISQLKNVIERDSAQAFNTAERLLKRDRKNPDLAAAIGQTFLKANRLADAEYFYDKGYHMYRISPTVINLAGDIALAKNDFKQAEYHYIQRKNNWNNVVCIRLKPSKINIVQTFETFRAFCQKNDIQYFRVEGISHTYRMLYLVCRLGRKNGADCDVRYHATESAEYDRHIYYVKAY